VAPGSSIEALSVPRVSGLSAVYFVRCQLIDSTGKILAANTYWESLTGDDIGPPSNDRQFEVKWDRLADMSALNTMPAARVTVSGIYEDVGAETHAHIKITNSTNHIAFFLRAEIAADPDGPEILPIRYDDNYITIFPRETRTVESVYETSLLSGRRPFVRVEGYDVAKQVAPLMESRKN